MKKSLLALAALTAFAGAASAQSSVTLFGIIDLAARNVENGSAGSLKTLSTNGQASSRLGFRGVEDLGGGMRAGFWLEGDISADVGGGAKTTAANGSTADPMTWNRRSTVSLMGNFGEIRLGRDYSTVFNNIAAYDMWAYQGVATVGNVRPTIGAVNTTTGAITPSGVTSGVRVNNAISYFTPAMGGFFAQVQVAATEGATGNGFAGVRFGYAAGPLSVSASVNKTKKVNTMIDDLNQFNVGGSYNLGFMTVQASYEKSDYSTTYQKIASGGVIVPIGAGNLKLNYIKTGGGNTQYSATLLGAGYVYNLSKRTSVYTTFGRLTNDGDGLGKFGGAFTASSSGPAGIKRGETSTGYDFGILHSF
jgi:predicted porin